MAEVFPDSWMRPEALPWVKAFIKALPLRPKDKKRTLEEWCKWSNVKLTVELVEEVAGIRAVDL